MSEIVRDEFIRNGLRLIDGVYYRLQGWGIPDDWRVEPLVRVPTDHAKKILREAELFDRLESAQSFAEEFLERVRDRLTEDEVRDIAYAMCGMTSEGGIRRDDPAGDDQ